MALYRTSRDGAVIDNELLRLMAVGASFGRAERVAIKSFFAASRNHLATSRSADSIFDPNLDGDFFDVIITRGAIDLLSDDDAFAWATQALTMLGPNGHWSSLCGRSGWR